MGSNKQLISEINSLLKQLSSEDLLYIKQQTSMLIYNQTVDQINQSNPRPTAASDNDEAATRTDSRDTSEKPQIIMDQSPNKMYVYISSSRQERVFFTVEEIAKMVDICQSAPDVRQIPRLLFQWLKKERTDFLNELNIGTVSNPLMKELCIELLERWGE